MNNYRGYELAEYAGDYLEEIKERVVLPVHPVDHPDQTFYGLFKFDGVIPWCSKEAKEVGLE